MPEFSGHTTTFNTATNYHSKPKLTHSTYSLVSTDDADIETVNESEWDHLADHGNRGLTSPGAASNDLRDRRRRTLPTAMCQTAPRPSHQSHIINALKSQTASAREQIRALEMDAYEYRMEVKELRENQQMSEIWARGISCIYLSLYILLAAHCFAEWPTVYLHSVCLGITVTVLAYWARTMLYESQPVPLVEETDCLLRSSSTSSLENRDIELGEEHWYVMKKAGYEHN
ncbi:hypothetical protein BJ878DRAFT_187544 [Calycina marina]|uniref:Uncharacterized protein n=1 Tax=Calycina marina TaxID=1763456 RepID=A0A9P8CCN6_9HELO|nr:hypothetical protein BJ878DRAFT_187544 [Calycina marina]